MIQRKPLRCSCQHNIAQKLHGVWCIAINKKTFTTIVALHVLFFDQQETRLPAPKRRQRLLTYLPLHRLRTTGFFSVPALARARRLLCRLNLAPRARAQRPPTNTPNSLQLKPSAHSPTLTQHRYLTSMQEYPENPKNPTAVTITSTITIPQRSSQNRRNEKKLLLCSCQQNMVQKLHCVVYCN